MAPVVRSPEFQIDAPYIATLVNMLEAAAQNPGVPAALSLWAEDIKRRPAWLEAFAKVHLRWQNLSPYFSHVDLTYRPYRRCSYQQQSVDDLVECWRRWVDKKDAVAVEKALREFDKILRPWWNRYLSRYTSPLIAALQRELEHPRVAELTRHLLYFSQLTPEKLGKFRVVVVAQPPGSRRLGRREDSVLIIEVPVTPNAKLDTDAVVTALHELAHYAYERSPARLPMEWEFARQGPAGFIASHYWGEVMASAFDGLGREVLDPEFHASDSLYGQPLIDVMAREFFHQWRDDDLLRMGPKLAQTLARTLEEHWPLERWRLSDFLFRTVVFAESEEAFAQFRNSMWFQYYGGKASVPERHGPLFGVPPAVSQVYLMSDLQARQHEALLKDLGTSPEAYAKLLRAPGGLALYRSGGRTKPPVFILVANNARSLLRGASYLGEISTEMPLPAEGWTPLKRTE